MAAYTFAEVDQIRHALKMEFSAQVPQWELSAMFVSPQRFRQSTSKGRVLSGRRTYKNVAGRCLNTFTSGMQNGATPQTRAWFQRTIPNKSKANMWNVKRYLTGTDDIINQHFQLSNLYGVLPLSYKDVGVFSNSAYAMLPDPKTGFWFYPYAIGTYAFSCDTKGRPYTFTRDFTLTVKQCVDTFGTVDKNGKVEWFRFPAWIKERYEKVQYQDLVFMSQVVLPNRDYDPAKKNPFDPLTKKWLAYTYVSGMGGGFTSQSSSGFRSEAPVSAAKFVKISGYNYFPVIIPRWEVQAEESYGIDGPTQMAINDIMTYQEMQKSRLEAINKLVRPPMVGHASLRRHQASILAGGITYVDDQGASHGFKPAFEMDPKISELILDMDSYENSISTSYFEPLFMQFAGEETKSHVTAAEIAQRSAEKMAALAPTMGQLDRDQNGPLIENAQIILEEAGMMPPRPRELEGEKEMPVYISILAQASKVAMMNSMERGVTFVSTLAGAVQDPTLLKLIKAEDMAREYLEYVAVKPTLTLDPEEYGAIKQQVLNEQQQQLQMQNQAQAASTAKDLAAAPVGQNSMLDSMLTAAGA